MTIFWPNSALHPQKAAKQAVPAQKQPASPAPSAPLVIDGVDFSEFLDNAPASRKTAAAPIPDPQPIREPVKTPEANKPTAPEKSAVTEDVPAPGHCCCAACGPPRGNREHPPAHFSPLPPLWRPRAFSTRRRCRTGRAARRFDAVSSAVLQSIDLTDMQEADAQMVRRLYGFAPSEMDGCLLYYPATNMGARELLLVKLSDLSQQTSVSDAIQARRQTQMKSFEGYGVEQYDLLSNSVVEIQGNYIPVRCA